MKMMVVGVLMSAISIAVQAQEPVQYLTAQQLAESSGMALDCSGYRAVAYRGDIYSPKGSDPTAEWVLRDWRETVIFVAVQCIDQLENLVWVRQTSNR